jgi:membrane-associated HD superfamily phosphohydrolase
MIITNHVKEGVDLAKQYKLPQSIIDIIKQHHGSALITYFYQKAKGHGNEGGLTEEDYRYPGPKPQTRVAALVMLADAVEASSRVLHDPTPARISALVDKIVNHIFLEGQLDECELTLKDISEIKKRFTYILTGIFHKRIDYPGFDFSEHLPKERSKIERPGPAEAKKGFKQGAPVARSSAS